MVTELLTERGHTRAVNTARDDVTEPAKVCVTVEGEPVAGDQVAVVDSHGADLVVADPDPGVRGTGPRDAVILTQVDDDLLQGVDVPFHPEQ